MKKLIFIIFIIISLAAYFYLREFSQFYDLSLCVLVYGDSFSSDKHNSVIEKLTEKSNGRCRENNILLIEISKIMDFVAANSRSFQNINSIKCFLNNIIYKKEVEDSPEKENINVNSDDYNKLPDTDNDVLIVTVYNESAEKNSENDTSMYFEKILAQNNQADLIISKGFVVKNLNISKSSPFILTLEEKDVKAVEFSVIVDKSDKKTVILRTSHSLF